MYKKYKNNLITITRGDSASFSFDLNMGTPIQPELYVLEENDSVYFGVTEPHQSFEHALIRKMYVANGSSSIVVTLEPKDTVCLLPGNYYYSLKLKKADGSVYTIIDKRKFTVID